MYENGFGTYPHDINKAVSLYQKAESSGLLEAKEMLGRFKKGMFGWKYKDISG